MQNKRIGEYLIEDGKLTEVQLYQALAIQAENFGSRYRSLLGTILCEMGIINDADLKAALERQEFDRKNVISYRVSDQ